jgi:hypothetical protein
MQKKPAYTQRIFNSHYFDKQQVETIPQIFDLFKPPMNVQTAYNCLKKHHATKALTPAVKVDDKGNLIVDQRFSTTTEIIEGTGVANHELGLDDFIRDGRAALRRGEMQITATNFLQAIKIKSDIEKSTKDRRMEMIKSFFATNNEPSQ